MSFAAVDMSLRGVDLSFADVDLDLIGVSLGLSEVDLDLAEMDLAFNRSRGKLCKIGLGLAGVDLRLAEVNLGLVEEDLSVAIRNGHRFGRSGIEYWWWVLAFASSSQTSECLADRPRCEPLTGLLPVKPQ